MKKDKIFNFNAEKASKLAWKAYEYNSHEKIVKHSSEMLLKVLKCCKKASGEGRFETCFHIFGNDFQCVYIIGQLRSRGFTVKFNCIDGDTILTIKWQNWKI